MWLSKIIPEHREPQNVLTPNAFSFFVVVLFVVHFIELHDEVECGCKDGNVDSHECVNDEKHDGKKRYGLPFFVVEILGVVD